MVERRRKVIRNAACTAWWRTDQGPTLGRDLVSRSDALKDAESHVGSTVDLKHDKPMSACGIVRHSG